ncbi:MAG: HIT domain-containing protein [Thaumarchaeota archaeon]|nr:HIT domain-containing protein [Nitrososphaerota archaeon]
MKRIPSTAGGGPEGCVFCGIVSGASPSHRVYEDEKYIAFLDAFPFSKGHTLVCPKEHGETIWDMKDEDIAELFRVASRVSRAVVAAVGADGFRFVQNNGEAANQVVAHVHVHVIPVKMEDRGRFVERRRFSEEEMRGAAESIKTAMKAEENMGSGHKDRD